MSWLGKLDEFVEYRKLLEPAIDLLEAGAKNVMMLPDSGKLVAWIPVDKPTMKIEKKYKVIKKSATKNGFYIFVLGVEQ